MNAQTAAKPQRRGACPGLSAPMPTGDGLLVRLLPRGTISLAALAALCGAARKYGNGVIEVTSRGSIQIRGLSETSARRFAETIAMLDIAADGVALLCNPLNGLDAEQILDCTPLAEDLRREIARCAFAARLSPKVSVVIDGGGLIDLDTVAADIRLRASGLRDETMFEVGVGGDAARAVQIGRIKPARGAETVLGLLDVIAQRGRDARARDVLAAEGAQAFRSAIGDGPPFAPVSCGDRRNVDNRAAIGLFALLDGTFACGIGLAFGHTNADALERLAAAAGSSRAIGLRTAPGRTLLAIGLTADGAQAFAARAARLGFIIRADDPRRKVIACAGAPICASAHIASRALGPAIAADAARFAGTIHISGCGKGCAHAGNAALTVVGMPEGCALIAHGSARDTAFAVVPESKLRAAIADHVRQHALEDAHV